MINNMTTIKINLEVKERLEKWRKALEKKLGVSKISFSDAINLLLSELEKSKSKE